jgi:hypothetical protein
MRPAPLDVICLSARNSAFRRQLASFAARTRFGMPPVIAMLDRAAARSMSVNEGECLR